MNIRSGPSSRYSKIGRAYKDAAYLITGNSGSWYKVDYNGKVGYIYNKFVSVLITPASTPYTSTPYTSTPSPTPTQTLVPEQTEPKENDKIISGYYASWTAYKGYTPLSIPADKLTHVKYAFANISHDLKITMGAPIIDTANFKKLAQLKKLNPHLKTLISVGGWTWSGKFSNVALTEQSRTAFADSVVAFIKQHGFDGVDIDWEFPVEGGLAGNIRRPEDKTYYTLLMAKLREKLNKQGGLDGRKYLLVFAGAPTTYYVDNVELKKLGEYADYAQLMAYDIHGSRNSYTDFNAPLYTPDDKSHQFKWSCDDAVELWKNNGLPESKIVLGIPFYGNIYSYVTNINNRLYQTFDSTSPVSYDEIATKYLNSGYSRFVHSGALVPWLYNGSSFISYDDADSVAKKADYINDRDLGGAAIWQLGQNTSNTLVNSIYDSLN